MLNSKQRSYLRSIGNGIKASYQVGWEGVKEGVCKSVCEGFNSNELIKVRLLPSCAQDPQEAAQECARQTESEAVSVIGRTFLLYRRSLEDPKIVLPQ